MHGHITAVVRFMISSASKLSESKFAERNMNFSSLNMFVIWLVVVPDKRREVVLKVRFNTPKEDVINSSKYVVS